MIFVDTQERWIESLQTGRRGGEKEDKGRDRWRRFAALPNLTCYLCMHTYDNEKINSFFSPLFRKHIR